MPDQVKPNIINKTLGEVLQNNTQAQGMVMQAMKINPEQLQQLLKLTGNNQLMNMTIADLFKNGIVQKATSANPTLVPSGPDTQINPQQFQQIMSAMQDSQTIQNLPQADSVPNSHPSIQPKQSILQKIAKFFK